MQWWEGEKKHAWKCVDREDLKFSAQPPLPEMFNLRYQGQPKAHSKCPGMGRRPWGCAEFSRAARACRSFDWIAAINRDLCSYTENPYLHLAVPHAVFKVSLIKVWITARNTTENGCDFLVAHYFRTSTTTPFQKHSQILPFGLTEMCHIHHSRTSSIPFPNTSNKRHSDASHILFTVMYRSVRATLVRTSICDDAVAQNASVYSFNGMD